MSDYDPTLHNRKYPPNHLAPNEGGTGLFWALVAIAVLGLLVLVGSFGSVAPTGEQPAAADAAATGTAAPE